jgi:UDP-N-acetylglucosamine 2-epimerase (non-hydrolysing)
LNHSIACIIGTRPEAIKMAPLILAAQDHSSLKLQLIATGQQETVFAEALAAFHLKPDVHLQARAGASVAQLQDSLIEWLRTNTPAMVLVQGDTNSALAGALAAHTCNIPLGHIEAGLRTHVPTRPFPEEANRVQIAKLATLHFAPCALAADNLVREGVKANIHITGNTGIDALLFMTNTLSVPPNMPRKILVTCHRRENYGQPLAHIAQALHQLAAEGAEIHSIAHPNPNTHMHGLPSHAPHSFPQLITEMRSARLLLTDSGGLQEEAAALGIPCLVLRTETERPELLASGNIRLVGSDTGKIIAEVRHLLHDDAHHTAMAQPAFPYGRGDAAHKIIALLEQALGKAYL